MEGLFAIAAEYLPIGTLTQSGIYVMQDVPVLLVKAQTLLTSEVLEKIKNHMTENRNVYVESNYYYKLVGTGVPQMLRQEFLEKEIGYTKLKDEADMLLKDALQNGTINPEKSEEVTEEICERISIIDKSILLQCINGENAVDEYLMRHSTNVATLNGMIGRWLGFDEDRLQLIIKAGLLHDIGKTQVPQDILNAPRALSKEEFAIIKKHALYSYSLICKIPNIEEEVAEAARSHHERLNGNGYPFGLRGDEISLFARITAISDTYDAMVSARCYKDAMNPFYVLDQIALGSFSDMDYQLTELFLTNMTAELVDKSVLLSNGAIGRIKFVNRNKLSYPIVEIDGEVVQTSDRLSCMAVIL